MSQTIAIIQIVIAVALIILILLQQRGSDSSGFLGSGGGGGGDFYQQRRGLERLFFVLTIVLTIAFAGLALTSLLYHESPAAAIDVITETEAASSTTNVTLPVSGEQTVNILPAAPTTEQ